MVSKVNHNKAFIVLEVVLVGLLGWVIVSSLIKPSTNAQAQELKTGQKLKASQRRWAPTEGKPVAQPLVAQAGTTVSCTTFDFAGGATQGFTTQVLFGTPLVLWHVVNANCRAFLTGHTTPYTFYYGQDATCNYDTGARNSSNLISPSISLAGKFAPFSVSFNYLLFVEGGGFDTTFTDISTNNGATWTQFLSKANLINDNQWHNVSANVTALVGAATSIRLRFRFDSIDNIANATTGWHVDDIAACGQNFNQCLQSDSGDNILRFNTVTGEYTFEQCSTGFTRSGIGVITTNGCTVTLTDNTFDHFVSATVDTCAHNGNAKLTYKVSPLKLQTFNIIDPNTLNNTCICP